MDKKKQEDEEFEAGMLAFALEMASSSKSLPYASRRLPLVTGLQWVEEKEQDLKAFYAMFRMRRSVFYPLHDLLVEKYGLKSTSNISSKEALALFLWTLGTTQTTDNVADRFAHSRSVTNKKFHEVLECVDRMAGDYIRPMDPSFFEPHPILRKTRFWPHFKNAIGAIDGTHIRVVVPKELEPQHRNRKGYTSENVMAVCDFDMRFTFVVPGWPGSVHDIHVWSDAIVRYEHFPQPPTDKYYLFDSGYPNRVGYLAPYKGQRHHVPDFQQHPPMGRYETFNHRHSSLRNVVERSFVVLKMKWRILQGIPRYKPETQKMIITACMCLHNYIRDSKLRDEHFDKFDNDAYVQPPQPFTGANALPPEDDGTMAATREAIAVSLVP